MSDFDVDFGNVSNVAASLCNREEKYWRENDAKFRAVAQHCNYDEFTDIVKASHLKSIEKRDKISTTDRKKCIWNAISSPSADSIGHNNQICRTTAPQHGSKSAFEKQWNSTASINERAKLIDSIPLYFTRSDFPPQFFTDILSIILEKIDEAEEIDNWIDFLSEIDRFSIQAAFVPSELRKRVQESLNRNEKQIKFGAAFK